MTAEAKTAARVGVLLAVVAGGAAGIVLVLKRRKATPRSQWTGGVNPDLPAQNVAVASDLPGAVYTNQDVNLEHLGDGLPTYSGGYYV